MWYHAKMKKFPFIRKLNADKEQEVQEMLALINSINEGAKSRVDVAPEGAPADNRRALESFNKEVAGKFGGYSYSGWRPAMAWEGGDKTPYAKIYVAGDYGAYGNMGEPYDSIFVPAEKLKSCLEFLEKNRSPFIKRVEIS